MKTISSSRVIVDKKKPKDSVKMSTSTIVLTLFGSGRGLRVGGGCGVRRYRGRHGSRVEFTGIQSDAFRFAHGIERTAIGSAISAAAASGWARAGGVTFRVMTFRNF